MTLNRRQFLRLAGLVAGGATVSACAPIYRQLSAVPLPLPPNLQLPPLSPQAFTALSRLTFGPTVEERWQVAERGWQAWIEDQLVHESIEDSGADWQVRSLESLSQEADALAAWDREQVVGELRRGTLLRRVYSARQLYERMVEFWTDHFNISVDKGDCWFLKTADDRQVVRRHALGNFRELLSASAHSPAMLIYLDNQANARAAPNENYARELLELHTLGVEAGYSQQDVMELARCLTGWTVKEHFWRGQFTFEPDLHDSGSKQVLGMRIKPAGQAEAEQVVDQLATHPATARHLADKLVRRFVSEQPAPDLVERAAAAFLHADGSIRAMLQVVLLDGLVQSGTKLKRPVDYVVGGLRTLAADTDAGPPIQEVLGQMGQSLFAWPTPDGPPDRSEYWASNLLPRWRFALDLSRNAIPGTTLSVAELLTGADPQTAFDRLAALLLGTPLAQPARDEVLSALRAGAGGDERTLTEIILAGLLASPGFQYQ